MFEEYFHNIENTNVILKISERVLPWIRSYSPLVPLVRRDYPSCVVLEIHVCHRRARMEALLTDVQDCHNHCL